MNQNKKTNSINDTLINLEQGLHIVNQRDQDRRRESSEGYTYISTVGWIDRREWFRREDDPNN
jgi:hypothetical protein